MSKKSFNGTCAYEPMSNGGTGDSYRRLNYENGKHHTSGGVELYADDIGLRMSTISQRRPPCRYMVLTILGAVVAAVFVVAVYQYYVDYSATVVQQSYVKLQQHSSKTAAFIVMINESSLAQQDHHHKQSSTIYKYLVVKDHLRPHDTTTSTTTVETTTEPAVPVVSLQKRTVAPLFPSSLPASNSRIAAPTTKSSSISSSNESIAACKLPRLDVDDPMIQPFLKHYDSLRCADMPNWVYTANGKFYISEEAQQKYGVISCDYIDLQRTSDDKYQETVHKNYSNGSRLIHESFKVRCHAGSHTYTNVHAGVPYMPNLHNRKPQQNLSNLGLNIYMYLMDSVSHVNFLRKLPNFTRVLTEEMDALIMEGFNVVGDGTPWTMIPVTTGHFQTELYEARKRFANASYLDNWPLIFKDMQKAGYVTSYSEEQPLFSFFSYKLKGFKDPPVDHYLRVFQQAANDEQAYHKWYCLGARPKSLALCDWWKEQQDMYSASATPTFSILFSSETSHDDYNLVQTLDSHWSETFLDQYHRGYFNNTLLLVMGDHGRRFGKVRQSQSGKTEEKLPFLAVVMPPWFKLQYPKLWQNLKTNRHRLVTPFDLHSTMIDVINFTSGEQAGVGSLQDRGISLFREIPLARSCRHAAIKPHFCSCLDWQTVDVTAPEVTSAATYAIGRLNSANSVAGSATCATLTLNKTISAQILVPNMDLLSFKESADYDNYFPDLSDNATLSMVIYQLRFVTAPNGGDYEVSINFYNDTGNFVLSLDNLSRLNMYGEQPKCILNSHPQLRQYCYCSELLNSVPSSASGATALGDTSQRGIVTIPQPDQGKL